MKHFYFKTIFFLFFIGSFSSIAQTTHQVSVMATVSNNALSLQGILDLDVPSAGSDGKAIHLVVIADISDLSEFGIGVANNGGGTDGMEEVFPVMPVSAGDNILLARSTSAMEAYFSDCYSNFEHVLVAGSSISQNGDDAIELYEGENVIETFGDINTDGTGEPWEYTDSWAYKVDGTWTYGGVNCSDDSQTTLSSNCIYPICHTGGDISGCMDETAFNYNPNATIDDGTCVEVIEGCMDDGAINYNADANTSCSSCCEYSGCTDSIAFNYDVDATTDDGSCIYDSGSLTNALILQGIMDFTVPSGGSDGKAIHLVATEDIADLSVFGLGVANNGGGTDGIEYSLGAVPASYGDDILIARSLDAMSAYFADCYNEFEIVLVASSAISQNGDDAIELYEQGVIIETFGDPDVDGSGEAWDYMDSWAYKVGDSWTYGGVDCTDGSQTSEASDCPYPICSDNPIDILGCMDSEACNYNPSATQNDGSCDYPDMYYDCDGNCINDTDMDGECDEVDYDDGLGVDELQLENSQVIKMIDMLGRVHTSHNSGMLLFYIYNNGKVQGVLKQ